MTLFEVNDMGSGLSMTSVNKIKELAEQREYELALDILDSQDLSKSLNPQFLRVCGDIYTKNGRYVDARRILIMAHRLAPEGKRVIFALVQLYLLMGYKDLAKQYYDIYMFDADEGNEETNQVKYVYSKACDENYVELEDLVHPYYLHNLDYDWSFETFLLLMKNGKSKEADIIASDFHATYKNSEYSRIIEDIQKGKTEVDKYFDIYPTQKAEDDDPEQEGLRQEEAKLLEADDLRINPREAEITIMVDDYEEVEIGTKRKLKKFLKEQEKLKKEEAAAESDNDETKEATEGDDSETKVDVDVVDIETEKVKAKGLFKKVFSKKKKVDETVEETEEKIAEEVGTTSEEQEKKEDTTEPVTETVVEDNKESVVEETSVEQTTDVEVAVETADGTDVEEDVSASEDDDTEVESEDTDADVESEDSDKDEVQMREIHVNKHNPIISVDIDDNDFAAESETIEGLRDEEFANPFDSISALKNDNDEPTFIQKRKTEFVFDDIDLSEDADDVEFEVDDFSSSEDDEFGEMKSYVEDITPEQDTDVDTGVCEDVPEESEVEVEEEISEEPKSEIEEETEVESEEELEIEVEEDIEVETEEEFEEEIQVETEEEIEEEIQVESEIEEEVYEEEIFEEPELEIEEEAEIESEEKLEVEVEEDIEVETKEEFEEEIQVETEEEIEEEIQVESEIEEEVYEEEISEEPELEIEEEAEIESEEKLEIEVEEDIEVEAEEEFEEEIEVEAKEEFEEEIQVEPEIEEEVQKITETPKKSIDFPVFRSSLFPNYNKKVSTVENNFQEIMTAGKDKIQENLLKEEQMQREAEALLASLGIDLGSITVTSNSIESINETLYDGPSRDELKSSLKIDSVKKNILRKLKEHR